MVSAVVTVAGGADLRAMVAALYAALELEVDPGTAGALDEVVPGLTAEAVAEAIRAAYAEGRELVAAEPDPALLAAARALTPRHAVR
jgi:hypothetical protein